MDKQLNDIENLRIDRNDKRSVDVSARKRGTHYRLLVFAAAGVVAITYLIYKLLLGSGIAIEVGTVTTAYPSQLYSILNATGYVVPQTKADIASKATGRLEWIGVEEGSVVKRGEIIARLENQDVLASMEEAKANVLVANARLKAAEAELTDATLVFNRTKDLIKQKFVSNEVHDAAAARYRKAVAAINIATASIAAAEAAQLGAKVTVEYTLIRAPFDGVILSKDADIGDVVAPFSSTTESKGSVVSMADMDTLEVEADVSESNLLKVHVGQPCEIQLDAIPDNRFRCVVNRIVPTVDRSKATVLVKVSFLKKHSRILPEMSAKVSFLSKELTAEEEKPVTVVQPSALVTRNGELVAFIINSNRVARVTVESGVEIGDLTTVIKGLNAGTKVVLNPPPKLEEGSKVSILSAS